MDCLFGLLHVAVGDLRCQGVWGTGCSSTYLHCVGLTQDDASSTVFAARYLRFDRLLVLRNLIFYRVLVYIESTTLGLRPEILAIGLRDSARCC